MKSMGTEVTTMGKGSWSIIAILLAILAAGVWLAVYGWNLHGDVEMSHHGYIALTLGVVFSLLVGFGLMGLVFYSSRMGYDEPPKQLDRDASKNAPR